jgi:cell volume regulation protein A
VLEVESGTNDPFAIFLTIVLVEFLLQGDKAWWSVVVALLRETIIGTLVGLVGGRVIVLALNRLSLPQGLHAPFVTVGVLVVFAMTQAVHGSGFLAAYLTGLVVGNRPTRAHNSVIAFLDAATWLAQIVMFVLLGLLVAPQYLPQTALPALLVAAMLTLVARPAAVFLCLAPFRFSLREKLFVSWVGLRGAVGIFLASIPLLVGLSDPHVYFDVAFVVVLLSLLIQGWTIAIAARKLHVALPRSDAPLRRVELDLPGQLEQELVGYPVGANSPYLRRRLAPSWAKLTLVIRDQHIYTPEEAASIREGDHVYLLAPPERAQALDRFFVEMPATAVPDPGLVEDFYVSGDVTLGALGEIYGLEIAPKDTAITLADHVAARLGHEPKRNDKVTLGTIALVAHSVAAGRVTTVGLQLAEPDPVAPKTFIARMKHAVRRAWRRVQAV